MAKMLGAQRKMIVLIVEDHSDLQTIITHIVERMGFSVEGAKNGREGVEKAVQKKPHLILMDILMPEMDGMEATRILRSNPDTHDIPILATTVLCRESELKNCIDAGCNDCLVKPFSMDQLRGKIHELIPNLSSSVH